MEPTSKPTCSPSSQFTETLEKKQVIDLASGQFSPFAFKLLIQRATRDILKVHVFCNR